MYLPVPVLATTHRNATIFFEKDAHPPRVVYCYIGYIYSYHKQEGFLILHIASTHISNTLYQKKQLKNIKKSKDCITFKKTFLDKII